MQRSPLCKTRSKPTIAIIGAGLAGGILASKLASIANVTVFERGPRRSAIRPSLAALDHPLGLRSTFSYGVGGTTNLWRGCLLPMERDEYGDHWPELVRQEITQAHFSVVAELLGIRVANRWLESQECHTKADEILPRWILVPRAPPRIAVSPVWRSVLLKADHIVDTLEERGSNVVLHIKSDRGSYRMHFDAALVCAGALNSPLILRRSQLGSNHVGKNLTDHPMGLVAKLAIKDRDAVKNIVSAESGHRTILKVKDSSTGLWTSFQLCPTHDLCFDKDHYLINANGPLGSWPTPPGFLRKLCNPNYCQMVANKALGRASVGPTAYVLAMLEQEPFGAGEVEAVSREELSVRWRISDASIRSLEHSLTALAKWLRADLHTPADHFSRRLWSGAHHAGTCRISSSPAEGVVDTDLRLHGHSRIYVCDSSVLPSTGASHIGLTIGSLAIRLANHLAARFQ